MQPARQEAAHFQAGNQSPPRQKNAQVVILQQESGQWFVLLQLRSYSMPVMPGHLAAVGGMRDPGDRDSSVTAVREVFEEAGLLDLGHLDMAPKALRERAMTSGAVPPRAFVKFQQGANVDWWALLLDGPGTFAPARDVCECADIAPLCKSKLPGARLAPCFGHAWLPTSSMQHVDSAVPLMGGLLRRVSEAVAAVEHLGVGGHEAEVGG